MAKNSPVDLGLWYGPYTMGALGRFWSAASALAVAGCFGTPDAGQGGPGSTTGSSDMGSSSLPPECGPLGALGYGDCPGFDDYVACMDHECAAGYDECLGAEWRSGDYEEAPCEELMLCIEGAANACEHACPADDACQSCIGAELTACEAYCAAHLECDGDDTPTGACAELETCCAQQETSLQELCLMDLRDMEPAGDEGCSVLLLTYCAN